jgi:hypothetical protein
MKNPGGRPALKPGIALTVWALVELLRDRQGNEPRWSARKGAKKLDLELRRSWRGHHALPFETIRDHHKHVERSVNATGSRELLLWIGRQRREVLGWDTSVLFFLIDQWKDYQAEIRDDGHIRLDRVPALPK